MLDLDDGQESKSQQSDAILIGLDDDKMTRLRKLSLTCQALLETLKAEKDQKEEKE